MEKPELLRLVAGVLTLDRSASMGDIAAKIGVSRTTLHRSFASRDALTDEVAHFAIDEVGRIYEAVGIDDRPAREVLEAMGGEVLNLAVAYWLLWSKELVTDVADLRAEADAFEERFQRFVERAQDAGVLRRDVPAAVLSYSINTQTFAIHAAVADGYVGQRAVKDLFMTTVLDGLGAPLVAVGSAP